MSWLLVAFIPGLLMLATFGLGRLEAGLEDDTVSPEDVVAFLEQAKADCAKAAAPAPSAQSYPLVDDLDVDGHPERALGDATSRVPVRVFVHHASNPEFRPTRHAFRV